MPKVGSELRHARSPESKASTLSPPRFLSSSRRSCRSLACTAMTKAPRLEPSQSVSPPAAVAAVVHGSGPLAPSLGASWETVKKHRCQGDNSRPLQRVFDGISSIFLSCHLWSIASDELQYLLTTLTGTTAEEDHSTHSSQ